MPEPHPLVIWVGKAVLKSGANRAIYGAFSDTVDDFFGARILRRDASTTTRDLSATT
jgi:hypothetical protein